MDKIMKNIFKNHVKIYSERLTFWINYLTVEFYWPKIHIGFDKFHFFFNTLIIYHDKTYPGSWYPFGPSFACKVLGFGIGLSWKNADNPKMKGYDYGKI